MKRLRLSLSSQPCANGFGSWGTAGTAVGALFMGSYALSGRAIRIQNDVDDHGNNHGSGLFGIEPQPYHPSGRYRLKHAVPT